MFTNKKYRVQSLLVIVLNTITVIVYVEAAVTVPQMSHGLNHVLFVQMKTGAGLTEPREKVWNFCLPLKS